MCWTHDSLLLQLQVEGESQGRTAVRQADEEAIGGGLQGESVANGGIRRQLQSGLQRAANVLQLWQQPLRRVGDHDAHLRKAPKVAVCTHRRSPRQPSMEQVQQGTTLTAAMSLGMVPTQAGPPFVRLNATVAGVASTATAEPGHALTQRLKALHHAGDRFMQEA